MIVLIDLDGTLTDTAHEKYKPYKDGLQETNLALIPIFKGAKEFIVSLKAKGHFPVIVSDSHPKYVKKIATNIFNLNAEDIQNSGELNQVICLADKPNIDRTFSHLSAIADEVDPHLPMIKLTEDKDNFIMIGDSWLDIELGRRLNIKTILTNFYKATSIEVRDGIGQELKPMKMGATYYAKTFDEVNKIIEKPIQNLLALEAIFQGENSENMVRFLTRHSNNGFIAFRCLARQEDGECDRFARADKYYQIDNPERTQEFVSLLAKSVTNYLKRVAKFPEYNWDYITYVSDKKTTTPPNKMKEIFDIVDTTIQKVKLFEWSENVIGSLRNQPNYQSRRDFISANLQTSKEIDLSNKNIIVIDDQFTSSATANEISQQLRNKGVKNILFISLFYLILPIESKNCPKCNKALKIKINKKNGNKFYSCLPPKFGGQGCGFIENIAQQ